MCLKIVACVPRNDGKKTQRWNFLVPPLKISESGALPRSPVHFLACTTLRQAGQAFLNFLLAQKVAQKGRPAKISGRARRGRLARKAALVADFSRKQGALTLRLDR